MRKLQTTIKTGKGKPLAQTFVTQLSRHKFSLSWDDANQFKDYVTWMPRPSYRRVCG